MNSSVRARISIPSVHVHVCGGTHNCMRHFVFFVRLETPMTGTPWVFTSVKKMKNMDPLSATCIYHESMLFFLEAQWLQMISFILAYHAHMEQVLKFC